MEIKKIELKSYTTDKELLLIASKADLEKRVRDSKLDETKKTFEGPGTYCEVTLEHNGVTVTCALPTLSATLDAVSGKYKPYAVGGASKVLPVVTDLIADNGASVFASTASFNPSTMGVTELTAIANATKAYLTARKASITDASITTQIDASIANIDQVIIFMSASGYKCNKRDVELLNDAVEVALTKAGVTGNNPTEVTTYLSLLTASKQLQEKAKTLSIVKNLNPKSGLNKFKVRHPKLVKAGKVVGPIIVAVGIAAGSIWGHNALTKDNNGNTPSSTSTTGIHTTVNGGKITEAEFNTLYTANLTRFQEFRDELGANYEAAVYGYTFVEHCGSLNTDSMQLEQIGNLIISGDALIECLVKTGQYGNISPEARAAINGGIETSEIYIKQNNATNGTPLLDYMTVGRSAEVRLTNEVSQNREDSQKLYDYNAEIYNPGLALYKTLLSNGIEMGASLNQQKTLGTHPAMTRA